MREENRIAIAISKTSFVERGFFIMLKGGDKHVYKRGWNRKISYNHIYDFIN